LLLLIGFEFTGIGVKSIFEAICTNQSGDENIFAYGFYEGRELYREKVKAFLSKQKWKLALCLLKI
jgi:hypothetical protein